MSTTTIPFSGNPLDRASDKRTDEGWIAAKRRDPSSLIIPLWRLEPFLIGKEGGPQEAGFLRPGLCENLAAPDAPFVFLGLDGEQAYFAVDISAAEDPTAHGPLAGLGAFRDLRGAGPFLSLADLAILGQAKAMIDWHNRHGFCSICGTPSEPADGWCKRVCPSCHFQHFPRTDPVVIMLATHSDPAQGPVCLLGRSGRFPVGFVSALAGFMEPGETIEEAVRRELKEEAGVIAGKVTYFTTQPWPFPSSLMIGCFAEAASRETQVDGVEITEVHWVSREDARAMLAGIRCRGLSLPPSFAIAHHLIKAWAEQER